jgi:nitrite reductase/ring-hydroxylating ferredoxin subunit/uncharacterized membrane protein
MRVEIAEPLDRWLQSQGCFEQVASTLQDRLGAWRTESPRNKRISDFLNGTPLGHSLHAILTDLTIGAWTAALILDGLALLGDDERLAAGADALFGVGLASVPATALAGAADWQYTDGRDRRVGLAHALTNTTASVLMGGSLLLRLRRRRSTGRGAARGLSALGYLVLLVGAHLGGDLAYRFGVAVNRQAWAPPIDDFKPVLDAAALPDNQPTRVEVDEQAIVLVRQGEQVYALAERCSHLGGPLAEGKVEHGCLSCPWHGSAFALADGQVQAGPATAPQPAYEVRVREGKIEVRGPRA